MVIQTPVAPKDKSIPDRYTPVTPQLLRQITRCIVAEFQPEQIVLFGSHAYGKPRVDSDIDVLVISNRLRHKSVLERDRLVADIAHAAISSGRLGMDILVRSPAELRYRLKIGDPFFREVMLKGRTLYKRPGSIWRVDTHRWRNRMPEPILVTEWIQKAEDDFEIALGVLRWRKNPKPALVCYHCQQSAEKYLKAFLLEHNIHFERTHHLKDLNELCVQADGTFQFIEDWLKLLGPYATETRYPGRIIEIAEAREAVATAKQVRKFVRAKLGLR